MVAVHGAWRWWWSGGACTHRPCSIIRIALLPVSATKTVSAASPSRAACRCDAIELGLHRQLQPNARLSRLDTPGRPMRHVNWLTPASSGANCRIVWPQSPASGEYPPWHAATALAWVSAISSPSSMVMQWRNGAPTSRSPRQLCATAVGRVSVACPHGPSTSPQQEGPPPTRVTTSPAQRAPRVLSNRCASTARRSRRPPSHKARVVTHRSQI